jgi:hypothetical protein
MVFLLYAAGIVSLVCWIMVLIQMFQREGVLLGILGILCSLWAFIWGWMNVEKTGQKQIMLIWTVAVIAGLVLQFTVGKSLLPTAS